MTTQQTEAVMAPSIALERTPALQIVQGDASVELKKLPAESVHMVVTSPPYDDLRTYGGLAWDFERIALELFRVMAQGGVIAWVVGDQTEDGSETVTTCRQKIFFRECGFRIHDTMIYQKTNFSNPERVRYHQVFEYVFILSKGSPRVFNPIKDKPNAYAGKPGSFGRNTVRQADGSFETRPRKINTEFGMRGNVWLGKTAGQEGKICNGSVHPAVMPSWLTRDLILSWSNPGDVVLDPFAGSFTTCRAALSLGRNTIGIEINPAYVELGRNRCAEEKTND
jgi:site-specific DNA-methyltransferase (adenine-specific)